MLGCPLEGVAADSVLDAGPALRGDRRALPRRPGVLEPAPQVQDLDLGLRAPLHQPRDQRRRLRRRRRARRHGRLRRLRRRRAVDQPDVRPATRRLRHPGRGDRGLGRRRVDLSRLRLPPLAQPRPDQVPDRRLGRRSGSARCSRQEYLRPQAARRPAAGAVAPAPRPRRRRAAGRRPLRGRRHDQGRPHVGHRACRRWPSSPAAWAAAGFGRPPSRVWSCSTCAEADDREASSTELRRLGLEARPSAFHRGTIACTGIEFCKLAIVETKGRAESIRLELEQRLPDFDTPITINVNGCPNSCARFQVADIGFKGIVQKATTARTSRRSRSISAASWVPRPRSGASSAGSR